MCGEAGEAIFSILPHGRSLKIAGLGQRMVLGTQAVSQVQVTGGGGLEEVMVQPGEKGVDL